MWLFHFVNRQFTRGFSGYLALVTIWISYEYLHLNWILNWPWLNLGNGFAAYARWVQWYEYTGSLGGTLWVLSVNFAGFFMLKMIHERRAARIVYMVSAAFIFMIAVPILCSFVIYDRYTEKKDPVDVVIVQPNIDPYKEQYVLPPEVVITRITDLGEQKTDENVDFMVAPESAIQEDIWENDLSRFPSLHHLHVYLSKHPHMNFIIGASTFKEYLEGEPLSHSSRKFQDADRYYDAYNTAFFMDSSGILGKYHKSKLTPGVEALPSFGFLKFIEKFAIDLGGTVGSLATDEERKVIHIPSVGKNVSATICYESVFGEFFSRFVRNGAQVMFIITNDGWWGNTAGHRQHFLFARLRAIETRRSIARSANTGISAFIDQRGDVYQQTDYWKQAVIRQSIKANNELTFYVKYGDYIALFSVYIAGVLVVISILKKFMIKQRKPTYE